jgi:hypothetical protein
MHGFHDLILEGTRNISNKIFNQSYNSYKDIAFVMSYKFWSCQQGLRHYNDIRYQGL